MMNDRKQEDQDYEAYLENGPRWDAWAKFAMNGTPAALADFIDLGGKIEGDIRHAVTDILRNGPPKNPGGKNRWRDYGTYVEIDSIKSHDSVSLRQAQIKYAEQNGRELRAVEKQYERGSCVFSRDCEK